ncbi:MAG: YdcF family protein [Chloroflexota bacterium]
MRARAAQRIAAGFLRGLARTVACVAGLLLLVSVLVLVQSQRDETRPAGAAIVLASERWSGDPAMRQARLDHALDLYRQGVISRLILTGARSGGAQQSEAELARAYLVERGVPVEVLQLEERGRTTFESLRNTAEHVRAAGVGSVLLVSDPVHMLRSLKMARDLGMVAYGSPAYNSPATRRFSTELGYVASEAWAYTTYLFFRR